MSQKFGIEIGGPSEVFSSSGILPLYTYIKRLDICNFSSNTVWLSSFDEDEIYKQVPETARGNIYIAEAVALDFCHDEKYDFLLASHVLEHLANPLNVLKEWFRVLKKGSHLIILVPRKNHTFDHRRPITNFDHLVDDYNRNVTEGDLGHLKEIVSQHDILRDSGAGHLDFFKKRSENNFENRCLHHHVFDSELLREALIFSKFELVTLEIVPPLHILAVARKPQ